MKFPNPCVRCGFCCLTTLCPAAYHAYGPDMPCKALSFHGDTATCGLAHHFVPVGDGCCIKARAYKNGIQFDFASMSKSMKILATRQVRGKNER